MTFEGLTSRCTSPCACRCSSAPVNVSPMRITSAAGSRARVCSSDVRVRAQPNLRFSRA
jgi:hypothetical protein